MERGEPMARPPAPGAAAVVGRRIATPVVVAALVLWFGAESAYPAGAWMEQQGSTSLAIALAAAILIAACVSVPAVGWLSVLAGALAAIPFALWLSIHVGASVYAASLGALLTALVLYAFMRAPAGMPVNPPDVFAAVRSLVLAVAGLGLLARVM